LLRIQLLHAVDTFGQSYLVFPFNIFLLFWSFYNVHD
jgi:hypothetical protein